jgi:hypothetical protein
VEPNIVNIKSIARKIEKPVEKTTKPEVQQPVQKKPSITETKSLMRYYSKPSSAWRDGTVSNVKDVMYSDGM